MSPWLGVAPRAPGKGVLVDEPDEVPIVRDRGDADEVGVGVGGVVGKRGGRPRVGVELVQLVVRVGVAGEALGAREEDAGAILSSALVDGLAARARVVDRRRRARCRDSLRESRMYRCGGRGALVALQLPPAHVGGLSKKTFVPSVEIELVVVASSLAGRDGSSRKFPLPAIAPIGADQGARVVDVDQCGGAGRRCCGRTGTQPSWVGRLDERGGVGGQRLLAVEERAVPVRRWWRPTSRCAERCPAPSGTAPSASSIHPRRPARTGRGSSTSPGPGGRWLPAAYDAGVV